LYLILNLVWKRSKLAYTSLRKLYRERHKRKAEVKYMLPESQKEIGIQVEKKRT